MAMKMYVYDKFWGGAIIVVTSDRETAVKAITTALEAESFTYNEENLTEHELVEGLVVETEGE